MVGKVVVVFNRLKTGRFAEETQMMDWNGYWEQSLKC